ncbi:MAG: choice-of-anchor X domain-containing protein [Vicinamibacteria bacterium]
MKTLGLATLLLALPLAGAAQDTAGAFAPGEGYVPPADQAPARVSRAFVRTVPLAPGSAPIEIPSLGSSRLLVWTVASGSAASPALRAPGGRVLPAGAVRSSDGSVRRIPVDTTELGLDLPGAQEAIEVRAAEAGVYAIETAADASGALTIVVAEPDSALTLAAHAGPLSRTDQPVALVATLRDGREPVSGARVIARLASPAGRAGAEIVLADDGRHGDGAADDGTYGGSVEGALAPGFWSVRFDAEGESARGAFARTTSSGFMSEPGAAVLADASGIPTADGLRVTARADVRVAGRYRFEVVAATTPGAGGKQQGVAWAESPRTLGAGAQALELSIPRSFLGDRAADALFLDVRLVGLDAPGVSRTTAEVAATKR